MCFCISMAPLLRLCCILSAPFHWPREIRRVNQHNMNRSASSLEFIWKTNINIHKYVMVNRDLSGKPINIVVLGKWSTFVGFFLCRSVAVYCQFAGGTHWTSCRQLPVSIPYTRSYKIYSGISLTSILDIAAIAPSNAVASLAPELVLQPQIPGILWAYFGYDLTWQGARQYRKLLCHDHWEDHRQTQYTIWISLGSDNTWQLYW